MSDPNIGDLTWETLTWQDIQAIGMALAERHPDEDTLTLAPERLARLVEELPGFESVGAPDDFLLSAITTAWINAQEGDDDSSPFEPQA